MALNKYVIAVLPEVTYGVNPFAGDPSTWLAVEDVSFAHVEGMIENADATASDSGRPHVAYGEKSTISFGMKLTGKSGAAGTGPLWAPLAEAAGLALTLNAAVDARLAPVTGNSMSVAPSCTIYLGLLDDTDDTVVFKQIFRGLRGKVSASGSVGEFGKLQFDLEGLYDEFVSASSARPSLPEAYSGEKKGLAFINATHTVAGTSYCIESWDWAVNKELKEDRCATSTNAVDEIYRDGGSRVGGSLTFKGRSATLAAILPKLKSGAESAHVVTLSDGTDTVSFESPAVQFGSAGWSKDGRWKFDVPYYCNGQWGAGKTGNNETVIIFT